MECLTSAVGGAGGKSAMSSCPVGGAGYLRGPALESWAMLTSRRTYCFGRGLWAVAVEVLEGGEGECGWDTGWRWKVDMVSEQEGEGRGCPLYTLYQGKRYRKDYPAVRIHACMRVYACVSKRDS